VNKQPAVYILASKRNGTLSIGVTSDLVKRIWEHKNNMVEGFTKRYAVHQLVGMKCMRAWNRLLSGRSDLKNGSESGNSN
jgi:putative endonuclease